MTKHSAVVGKVMVMVMVGACGGGGDANLDATVTVDARTHSGTAMSHTMFVNTEGVTLLPGADDATTNKTSLINAMATLKPYRVGDAARSAKIAAVITRLQSTLAPYDVDVVTTRPDAGPYDMMVVTDDRSNVLPGFSNVGAVTSVACNQSPSVVGIVFPAESVSATTDAQFTNDIANTSISMFGVQNGIPASSVKDDCMCLAATACDPFHSPCTIGGASTMIDTGNGGAATCGTAGTTMDEGAKFLAAFGTH